MLRFLESCEIIESLKCKETSTLKDINNAHYLLIRLSEQESLQNLEQCKQQTIITCTIF